jgi:methylated-DNA-[protein]-cysteine S-methyltransferase
MAASFVYSPFGTLQLIANELSLENILFSHQFIEDNSFANDITRLTAIQLAEYFEGDRKTFNVPLSPKGSDFQLKTWQLLQSIPFGTTISYKELALMYGDPKAIRALASANGKNPIPIIIPCHRVIGNDGQLVGYSGGLDKKEKLLRIEGLLQQGSFF